MRSAKRKAQRSRICSATRTKRSCCFDQEKLAGYLSQLSPEFRLAQIDEALYREALKHDFSRDWCSQFDSAEDFRNRGLGYCILRGNEIVSGASSYIVYSGGIEVQIDTTSEYHHRGLATACASALILECLARGLYPSWDAQNRLSVALAEKLGYHFDFVYTAYEINL